jgi:hypothetical protein
MLRYAASFVIAAYVQVRLIPHDLRALPAELFTRPSRIQGFCHFLREHQIWNVCKFGGSRLFVSHENANGLPSAGGKTEL